MAPRASAHPIVTPDQSPPGTSVRYVLSVPTEKPLAVQRVEVQFPRQLRVNQVESIAGWNLTLEQDSGGRVLGAIWDGGRVGPGGFFDVVVLADNPGGAADLAWSVIQTYDDASEVQWTGPPQSQFPSAVSHVGSATPPLELILAGVALALSVLAFALSAVALRAGRRAPKQ